LLLDSVLRCVQAALLQGNTHAAAAAQHMMEAGFGSKQDPLAQQAWLQEMWWVGPAAASHCFGEDWLPGTHCRALYQTPAPPHGGDELELGGPSHGAAADKLLSMDNNKVWQEQWQALFGDDSVETGCHLHSSSGLSDWTEDA
jgi:hypothetical protein